MALQDELMEVLNRHSAENGSNTPDFILAEFLMGVLVTFDRAVQEREWWYGRQKPPAPAATASEPTTGEPR